MLISAIVTFAVLSAGVLLYLVWYGATYDRRRDAAAKQALAARIREADREIVRITVETVRKIHEIQASARTKAE